jgi:glycosyltransferase involved in cell wall biosynthesis
MRVELSTEVGRVPFSTLQIGWITLPDVSASSGAERYYLGLLRSLAGLGVGVRGMVLGRVPPEDLGAARVEAFAPVGTTRRERVERMRGHVRALLDECDLVVSHCAPHAFPVLDLIRERQRAFVVHFHGPWALERLLQGTGASLRAPLSALQELNVYRRAKRVIVLFEAYARLLEGLYRVDRRAIRVVPGGVDLERFGIATPRLVARAWFGLPSDAPVIATIARLARGKAILRLIDAFALLRRRIPDAVLVVAGDGPLSAAARERVAACRLDAHVRFLGHRDVDLPLVYRAADLSVTTAFGRDGFGLVVPESLACGTPVSLVPLGPVHDGASEALRVLPGGRPEQIASGLLDALRRGADEHACREAALPYDWRLIAARVRAVYEEAL